MKIQSNFHLKWIMKSALLQHGSNWASLWLFKKAYKTCAILLICSKRPQNDVVEIFEFSSNSSNLVKWPPRAPVERPETPPEASDNPNKHQNQGQWTRNHVKFTEFHMIKGVLEMCWNSKTRTPSEHRKSFERVQNIPKHELIGQDNWQRIRNYWTRLGGMRGAIK